ncbi:MAG: hypothetical protein A3K19_08660 [Lentisphaerae bacterium RIFOXYB12_FULL_65_16]|nr:MAG: hypothetical protein A3K18_05605 [Lentisphaerae bacterium RIFOXYA12_64_32]OGV89487.1 MAG: hypothetical protein A3K19_08660 [Lentisphaerae bacterium RIFOXYB12_FULL_65_16]
MPDTPTRVKQHLARRTAEASHDMERIQTEIAFGNALCGLHPKHAAAWRPLLDRAAGLIEAAADSATGLKSAVADAEKRLAPLAKAAKAYTVYAVGHGHIDMNWMWSWPETVAVTNDTFATVLRLMDEYPAFHYSQSQASVYAIMEQYNPDLLTRIAERVSEGRWEVTASHWVENDKNIVSGEALCRHLLYTRRYMQKLFGLAPDDVPIDWSPDTFGHAATIPTYLARGGVRYVYMHRPGVYTQPKPKAFRWRAPDGSEVLVHNDMAIGYNGVITPGITGPLLDFVRETGLPFAVFVYGVGDHGGGPTRRDILRALDMTTWPVFPNIVFSTARAYFERLDKEGRKLPRLDTELNVEFAGCFTTQTLIKKANRFGEKRLADAETAAAVAWAALGRDYPAARFEDGWRDVLFSHFHDILPGSGVHDTRTYCHGQFQKTMAMTSMEETNALRHLAAQVDTSDCGPAEPPDLPPSRLPTALGAGVGYGTVDGGLSHAEQSAGHGNRPFLVFNPTVQDRAEVAECTVWDNVHGWRRNELNSIPFAVRNPDGDVIPAQTIETGAYWAHDFVRLAFPVKVSGCGYGLYTVLEEKAPSAKPGVWQLGQKHHCAYAASERSLEGLENALLRLELDPVTGAIKSLIDKRSKLTLIATQNAPALEYAVERPHGMTAWVIDHTGPVETPQALGLARKWNGPYKAAIDVKLRIHESEFTLTYELRANDPNLYLHLTGTWFQRGTPQTGVPVLALAVPLQLTNAEARYEIPFGALERPGLNHGEEVPALRWAQVTGKAGAKSAGCLLLNDSKHGHSLNGSTLRLTLIRGSYDPDPLPEIGRHEVHLALQPFSGAMPVAEAIRQGIAFNHALRIMGTDIHDGTLPTAATFASAKPESAILITVKKAEDDDALILRFFDPTGKATVATATLDRLLGKVTDAVEVDLLERPTTKSTAKTRGNTVSVKLPARGIASVKVRMGK